MRSDIFGIWIKVQPSIQRLCFENGASGASRRQKVRRPRLSATQIILHGSLLGLKWIIVEAKICFRFIKEFDVFLFNDHKVQVKRVHLEPVKHFPIFTIIVIEFFFYKHSPWVGRTGAWGLFLHPLREEPENEIQLNLKNKKNRDHPQKNSKKSGERSPAVSWWVRKLTRGRCSEAHCRPKSSPRRPQPARSAGWTFCRWRSGNRKK